MSATSVNKSGESPGYINYLNQCLLIYFMKLSNKLNSESVSQSETGRADGLIKASTRDATSIRSAAVKTDDHARSSLETWRCAVYVNGACKQR